MIKIPDQSGFPGTGDKGNGLPEKFKTQDQWLNFIKTNGCGNCHQMGNYATRTIPAALGQFESARDAWERRLQSGPAGHDMVRFITELMTPDGGHLAALADWTDRIKAGELPSRSPARPIGVERNIVVTVRDRSDIEGALAVVLYPGAGIGDDPHRAGDAALPRRAEPDPGATVDDQQGAFGVPPDRLLQRIQLIARQ